MAKEGPVCRPALSFLWGLPHKKGPNIYRLFLSPKTSMPVSDRGLQTQELSLQSLFCEDLKVLSDAAPCVGQQLWSLSAERHQHGSCFSGPRRWQELRLHVPGKDIQRPQSIAPHLCLAPQSAHVPDASGPSSSLSRLQIHREPLLPLPDPSVGLIIGRSGSLPKSNFQT